MPLEDIAVAFWRILIQLKEGLERFTETTDMRRSLDATVLTLDDVEPAFALVQALHPSLSLETWRKFAGPLIAPRPSAERGLIGVRNEADYLCGLFVYRVEADLSYGRAFVVDVVAALDVVDAGAVIGAILEAAQAMADRLRCRIVRIRVASSQTALAAYLREAGLGIEGQVLSKSQVG
jgi:hypothetical protein